MKNSFLIVALLYSTIGFSQKFTEGEAKAFDSKEIVFFGYDFSHFKLAEIKRLNEPNLEKYIPAWLSFMQERRTEESYAAQLKKDKVTFDFDYTIDVAKNYKGEDMVVMNKHSIPRDSIKSIVSNIRTKENSGIGFVIIAECFEKANQTASAYYIFFDIATKEVLMTDYYARNEADGYGMGNYWGQALHAITGYYTGDIYRENLKRFQKGKDRKEPSKWEIQN